MLSLPNDGRYPVLELAPQAAATEDAGSADQRKWRRCRDPNPMLMIFEDVHWIDPTSLEVARSDSGSAEERSAVLLIVTYRPEFEPPWIGRASRHGTQPQSPR